MKISQLKKKSRKIIKGNVKSSAGFLIFLLLGVVLFSALPFFVDFWLKEKPTFMLPILILILLLGFGWFSSFRTGSYAWFLFHNKKRRSEKALFWLRPSKSASSARLYFALFFRKLLWALAFLSPGATVVSAAVIIAMSGGVEFNLFATWFAGGVALMLTGAGFLYFFLQRFFLVPYLKISFPSMKNREIFKKSREYMSQSVRKTALMKISFLPWIILSLTIIPSFYIWSYYSQSCAVLAQEICRANVKKITDTNL